MTCPYGHADAAYVLGALSPAERTAFERHMAGCEACTGAVAMLAPVPGLLGRADPAAIKPAQPRPTRVPALLLAVSVERRRRAKLWRLGMAGAVLMSVVLAVVGTAAALGVFTGPPAFQEMRPVVLPAPVVAEVVLAETDAGTEIRLRCSYPDPVPVDDDEEHPEPYPFVLVAVGDNGTHEQLGSWLAAPGDEITMTGITRFTGDGLARLDLRSGADGSRLLTYRVE